MKKLQYITFIAIIALFTMCNEEQKETDNVSTDLVNNPNTLQEGKATNTKLPAVEFEVESFDFGEIVEGEIVEYTFKFKNTGEGDLIISNARASCGCTIPYFPKEPIKPGESNEMKVSFNSKGKSGKQTKQITVFSNANPNKTIVTILGNVKPAK